MYIETEYNTYVRWEGFFLILHILFDSFYMKLFNFRQ